MTKRHHYGRLTYAYTKMDLEVGQQKNCILQNTNLESDDNEGFPKSYESS